MKLAGANPNARVSGAGALPGKINHLIGNDPKKWTSGATAYRKVKYQQLYKGVDLVHYGAGGRLEYDFKDVESGRSPSRKKEGATRS
jgi:hypothetical protein